MATLRGALGEEVCPHGEDQHPGEELHRVRDVHQLADAPRRVAIFQRSEHHVAAPARERRGADEGQGQRKPQRQGAGAWERDQQQPRHRHHREQDVGRLECVEITRPFGDLGGGESARRTGGPQQMGRQRHEHYCGGHQSRGSLHATRRTLPRQPRDPASPQMSPARACIQDEERTQGESLDDEAGVDDGEHPLVQERAGGRSAGGRRGPAQQPGAELQRVADHDRAEQTGGGPGRKNEEPDRRPSTPWLGEQQCEHDYHRIDQGAGGVSDDHRGVVLEQHAAIGDADAAARHPCDLEREIGHAGSEGQSAQDSCRTARLVEHHCSHQHTPYITKALELMVDIDV